MHRSQWTRSPVFHKKRYVADRPMEARLDENLQTVLSPPNERVIEVLEDANFPLGVVGRDRRFNPLDEIIIKTKTGKYTRVRSRSKSMPDAWTDEDVRIFWKNIYATHADEENITEFSLALRAQRVIGARKNALTQSMVISTKESANEPKDAILKPPSATGSQSRRASKLSPSATRSQSRRASKLSRSRHSSTALETNTSSDDDDMTKFQVMHAQMRSRRSSSTLKSGSASRRASTLIPLIEKRKRKKGEHHDHHHKKECHSDAATKKVSKESVVKRRDETHDIQATKKVSKEIVLKKRDDSQDIQGAQSKFSRFVATAIIQGQQKVLKFKPLMSQPELGSSENLHAAKPSQDSLVIEQKGHRLKDKVQDSIIQEKRRDKKASKPAVHKIEEDVDQASTNLEPPVSRMSMTSSTKTDTLLEVGEQRPKERKKSRKRSTIFPKLETSFSSELLRLSSLMRKKATANASFTLQQLPKVTGAIRIQKTLQEESALSPSPTDMIVSEKKITSDEEVPYEVDYKDSPILPELEKAEARIIEPLVDKKVSKQEPTFKPTSQATTSQDQELLKETKSLTKVKKTHQRIHQKTSKAASLHRLSLTSPTHEQHSRAGSRKPSAIGEKGMDQTVEVDEDEIPAKPSKPVNNRKKSLDEKMSGRKKSSLDKGKGLKFEMTKYEEKDDSQLTELTDDSAHWRDKIDAWRKSIEAKMVSSDSLLPTPGPEKEVAVSVKVSDDGEVFESTEALDRLTMFKYLLGEEVSPEVSKASSGQTFHSPVSSQSISDRLPGKVSFVESEEKEPQQILDQDLVDSDADVGVSEEGEGIQPQATAAKKKRAAEFKRRSSVHRSKEIKISKKEKQHLKLVKRRDTPSPKLPFDQLEDYPTRGEHEALKPHATFQFKEGETVFSQKSMKIGHREALSNALFKRWSRFDQDVDPHEQERILEYVEHRFLWQGRNMNDEEKEQLLKTMENHILTSKSDLALGCSRRLFPLTPMASFIAHAHDGKDEDEIFEQKMHKSRSAETSINRKASAVVLGEIGVETMECKSLEMILPPIDHRIHSETKLLKESKVDFVDVSDYSILHNAIMEREKRKALRGLSPEAIKTKLASDPRVLYWRNRKALTKPPLKSARKVAGTPLAKFDGWDIEKPLPPHLMHRLPHQGDTAPQLIKGLQRKHKVINAILEESREQMAADPRRLCKEYSVKYGIEDLFEFLMFSLITNKPDNPVHYLIELTKTMKENLRARSDVDFITNRNMLELTPSDILRSTSRKGRSPNMLESSSSTSSSPTSSSSSTGSSTSSSSSGESSSTLPFSSSSRSSAASSSSDLPSA